MLTRIVAAILLLAAPVTVQAQGQPAAQESQQTLLEQRADQAAEVLNGERAAEEVFAPSFLAAVSRQQLVAIAAQKSAQYGALKGVAAIRPNDNYTGAVDFRFENAIGKGQIQLDPTAPNKIAGLQLLSFESLNDSIAKINADLGSLSGDVSVLFARLDGNEEPILSVKADRQSAIGSTFKLYILSALARSIENGERKWSDVVTLDRKSFPSGKLQDWPDGSPLTLHTLAAMMISISDNSATDMLLRLLGRDTVEAELVLLGHSNPARTLPFLSTLEMFALKGSPGNMAKYIAADQAGRRFILADFEDDVGGNLNLITPPRFVEPTAIDTLEWFANGHDLANVARRFAAMKDPAARQIMAVNTALPQTMVDDWQYVGFKGGSEPGVLNLTWFLQDEAGRWHILTMSWNNKDAPVDEAALVQLGQRLLPFAF